MKMREQVDGQARYISAFERWSVQVQQELSYLQTKSSKSQRKK